MRFILMPNILHVVAKRWLQQHLQQVQIHSRLPAVLEMRVQTCTPRWGSSKHTVNNTYHQLGDPNELWHMAHGQVIQMAFIARCSLVAHGCGANIAQYAMANSIVY